MIIFLIHSFAFNTLPAQLLPLSIFFELKKQTAEPHKASSSRLEEQNELYSFSQAGPSNAPQAAAQAKIIRNYLRRCCDLEQHRQTGETANTCPRQEAGQKSNQILTIISCEIYCLKYPSNKKG
jgi:hypothetical protein